MQQTNSTNNTFSSCQVGSMTNIRKHTVVGKYLLSEDTMLTYNVKYLMNITFWCLIYIRLRCMHEEGLNALETVFEDA